eukprot:CAMPEP_0181176354 /NCGR_PEP_ID=MMETSP1096-20121128/4585_1 /TAXON_ID=156174 ORGANISM="Chrysochromulina ericina, Strain CCMP281" /NCGR_SAMPLE_ID=MMETSP1096 /ASSEMBLY_ACC=CAM_ASM_000453 /LENGTH=157 /DNA_ID=CAMNT_0023264437 /DNA_START=341 /DNA_END=819 /DNA_ORIENTATION=+
MSHYTAARMRTRSVGCMWSRVTRKLNHVLLLGQPDGGHQQERKQGVRYNRHSVNSSVACQNDSRWMPRCRVQHDAKQAGHWGSEQPREEKPSPIVAALIDTPVADAAASHVNAKIAAQPTDAPSAGKSHPGTSLGPVDAERTSVCHPEPQSSTMASR